jgi:hypothetical protein
VNQLTVHLEDYSSADTKSREVVTKLRAMKLPAAAELDIEILLKTALRVFSDAEGF